MQQNLKKARPRQRIPRIWALPILALVAAVLFLAAQRLQAASPAQPTTPVQDVILYEYAPDEVQSLRITRRGESPWQVTRDSDGLFVLEGSGYRLSEADTRALANAACILTCEEILTEDPADYADHLADYGLASPSSIAAIGYEDGTTVTLRIGDSAPHTSAWYYALIDGDARLFAFPKGVVQDLFVSEASLYAVEQPILHKARIDRITLTTPDGTLAEWALDADITDADAIDRWRLTAPFAYPADATAMENLLTNAGQLRLGTYLAPATPENLTRYGFNAPRMAITLHMAAGTIATTGMSSAVTAEDYPESSVTFVIGGAENDLIDYVRCGGHLYRCSHFSLSAFLNADPQATMSRYLLPVALGNLATLTIEQGGTVDTYVLTRTEQVAENNDLIYDAEGQIIYDVAITRNGEALDYAQFEAAYGQLVTATVSGTLPEGAHAAEAPHTVYTFTDLDGSVHTVALAAFDALHDAVILDGHEAFYLIKGGFVLIME